MIKTSISGTCPPVAMGNGLQPGGEEQRCDENQDPVQAGSRAAVRKGFFSFFFFNEGKDVRGQTVLEVTYGQGWQSQVWGAGWG